MTVSLALRHSREVSAATRQRIQRLARAHGYRPDPAIVRLMHHLRQRRPARAKANLAGLLGARWTLPQRTGNFMSRLCEGLTARADALGYAFSVFSTDDYPGDGQLGRVLASRGIEGLIILPLPRPADLSDLLDWSAFSVVSATPSVLAPHFHAVMPNHFENMLTVCAALTAQGFQRIGLAIPSDWDARVRHRWTGALLWQNAFGATQPIPPLLTPGPGPVLDLAAFVAWLRREKPAAVISAAISRSTLVAGLARLPALLRPKIITMNWPDPPFDAGLDQRPEHLGASAIDVLAGQLTRGEKGIPAVPSSTLIEGAWQGPTLVLARTARRKIRRPAR